MTKEEIIDNIARLNSETWRDREEVRTEIGKLLAELKKELVAPTRKVGKWIEEPNCYLRCSCCNSHYPHISIYAIKGSNYCPNCGAEMRG